MDLLVKGEPSIFVLFFLPSFCEDFLLWVRLQACLSLERAISFCKSDCKELSQPVQASPPPSFPSREASNGLYSKWLCLSSLSLYAARTCHDFCRSLTLLWGRPFNSSSFENERIGINTKPNLLLITLSASKRSTQVSKKDE